MIPIHQLDKARAEVESKYGKLDFVTSVSTYHSNVLINVTSGATTDELKSLPTTWNGINISIGTPSR